MSANAKTAAMMLPITRSLKPVLHPVHQYQGLGKKKQENQQGMGETTTTHGSAKEVRGLIYRLFLQ